MSNIEVGAPAAARPGGARISRILIQAGLAVILLVGGGVIALIGERFLGAGGNETRIMTFQDWRVGCPPRSQAQARCVLAQDVVRDQGGAVVSMALDNAAVGSNLTVTVPHGVLLGPGLGFAPGNEPIRARPYETCNPGGCMAFVKVDAPMLKSLRESVTGQVVVVPNNGSPATIPFSLKGFSEGYDQLVREQARRESGLAFLLR